MKPARPVMRYHGGKWKLAPWIIEHFPKHKIYVEPFGGAASVLIQKPRSYGEVFNDVWGVVVNVFRVLRDPAHARELERQIRLTPFAREEFEACDKVVLSDIECPIERARRTIFRSFAGFGSAAVNGEHATGFRATTKRAGTTPAQDWQGYPDSIRVFTERLQGVVIENRPAVQVIEQHDSPETLHYVDPPYPHATRNMRRGNAAYACEMSDEDHRTLACSLHAARGGGNPKWL